MNLDDHRRPRASRSRGFVRFVETGGALCDALDAPHGETVTLNVGHTELRAQPHIFRCGTADRPDARDAVERAALSIATPFARYDVPANLAGEAAELYNGEFAALCKAFPDRFEGWAYLPMQDTQAAAKELRRCVRLGLVGGYLPSNVQGRYLDRAEFAPIFDAATELDVPLLVHPSNPPARERMAEHELAVVAGYLFDSTLNIFHMIFGGLLDRYPTLRLCCTHLGGYAPMLRARMQRELDTNPQLAARLQRPLGEYLRALSFDTICFEPRYARFVVDADLVDASHLLLGSEHAFSAGRARSGRVHISPA